MRNIEVICYNKQCRQEVRERLEEIQEQVLAIDKVVEGFDYKMPSYKYLGKPLVYMAAFKNHIGVYALPTSHAAFEDKLTQYKRGKGSVQVPHYQDFPLDLILEMILHRKEELDQQFRK